MPTSFDVDDIADGLANRGVTRRQVAKGAAWSLPVIAASMAVPAKAAQSPEPPVCIACAAEAQNCFLQIGQTGACKCAPGLVCVGTGPLGLANICVGTDLLLSTCGGGTCYGVCIQTDGAVIVAFNALVSALTVFTSAAATALLALGATNIAPCVHAGLFPQNVCVSPLADGQLGSVCVIQHSSNTGVIGTALGALTFALNGLLAALSALNILVSNSCQAPYVCKDGASVSINWGTGILTAKGGYELQVGVCQCPPQGTVCDSPNAVA